MKRVKIKNHYYEPDTINISNAFYTLVGGGAFLLLIAMLVIGTQLSKTIISSSRATGVSMNPTFDTEVLLHYNKSDIVIDRLTYHDIIAFDTKQFGTYIKRIIGLPGDTIEIINKKLYINGQFVQEDFIIPDNSNAPLYAELGEDEYFVMGDNRASSTDSRHVLIGAVKKSAIKGRVIGGKSLLSDETYNLLRVY